MRTIAKFVDGDAACERLRRVGVGHVQGFAMLPPGPLPEAIDWRVAPVRGVLGQGR